MLVFIIAIYKRHKLTRIVLDTYRELQKKYPFRIVIAGSEGDISRDLAHGFDYIETDNYPLTFKNNAMMQKARELNPDAVVLMGSDDIINEEVLKYYYSLIEKKETRVCGFSGIYYYDYIDKVFTYYDQSAKFGAGRFFPRNVLEQIDYKGWEIEKNKGCDAENSRVLAKHGLHKIHTISLKEIGGLLVDIKGGFSISSKNITLVGEKSNISIMARGQKKVITKLDNLAKEEKAQEVKGLDLDKIKDTDEVTFVSNGKGSKMPHGQSYIVSGNVAKILIKKGFGYVED